MVRGLALVKAMFTGPPPVVVTFALIVTWLAEREIPELPVVERAPLKVASPTIFVPAIEAALIALAVIVLAPAIERALRGVVPPKAPFN